MPNHRVRLDLIVGILLTAAVLLFCAFVAFGSVQTQPPPKQSTPAAAPMRECPYCHKIYAGFLDRKGEFHYTNHPFIRLPLSETKSFETCVIGYRDHLIDCFVEMAKVGAGQLVNNQEEKP
jgi:hypothetical protein